LAEMPGISGNAPRRYGAGGAAGPYPQADEIADSAARVKGKLKLSRLDGVGHSYGGGVLNHVVRYRPDVFERIAMLESGLSFAYMTDCFPFIYEPCSWGRIGRLLLRGEMTQVMMAFVFGETWHQYVLKRCLSPWEWTTPEARLNGNALVMVAERDLLMDGRGIASWLAEEFPSVTVKTQDGEHAWLNFPWRAGRSADMIVEFLDRSITH